MASRASWRTISSPGSMQRLLRRRPRRLRPRSPGGARSRYGPGWWVLSCWCCSPCSLARALATEFQFHGGGMNKLDLAGRVAIVTGGVSGIGLAIAQRMAESGATLSLWDRDGAALARMTKEHAGKTKVHSANVDISSHQQVVAAAKDTASALGKIDILVNCAGVAGANAMLWEFPVDEWVKVHNVNLHGVFYACREVVPYLQKNGYGLQLFQGGSDRSHQVARQGTRKAKHHGQLRHASCGQDADFRSSHAAAHRLYASEDSDGPVRA